MNQEESPKTEVQQANVVPQIKKARRGRPPLRKDGEGGRKGLFQGKRGHRCSSYGCNRSFLNMQDLISHMSVHYKPTESLKDKQFVCSTGGCKMELASMQELMSHLKVHYKPNRYFKCENCMQHFRTHRSLFKHLHVCSDPTGQNKKIIENHSLSAGSLSAPPPTPKKTHTSVIQCVKKEVSLSATSVSTTSNAEPSTSSLPEDIHYSMSSLLTQASNPFSPPDPSLFAGRLPNQSSSSVAGSYLPYLNPTYSLSQVSIPQRFRPFLGNQSLPISNAVWKKNHQGHTTNSRILWEHTRDSYNCMQCTFSAASRDQMTKHIEEQHKIAPSARIHDEMDYEIDLLPFQSKLPPEMEPKLFQQL
ncbi:hypothetical protein GDO86_001092 [Hymenochirus boettgeri]|uniref:C2H2-type domain-containing protein n=1 Tax=Hymenochirus boettgeri TaxID=247094 RepID=A0A8T2KDH6_9PIPI|nr:hypothetical protein GDO86_001092 [Hymenochirus boettgeri]